MPWCCCCGCTDRHSQGLHWGGVSAADKEEVAYEKYPKRDTQEQLDPGLAHLCEVVQCIPLSLFLMFILAKIFTILLFIEISKHSYTLNTHIWFSNSSTLVSFSLLLTSWKLKAHGRALDRLLSVDLASLYCAGVIEGSALRCTYPQLFCSHSVVTLPLCSGVSGMAQPSPSPHLLKSHVSSWKRCFEMDTILRLATMRCVCQRNLFALH